MGKAIFSKDCKSGGAISIFCGKKIHLSIPFHLETSEKKRILAVGIFKNDADIKNEK